MPGIYCSLALRDTMVSVWSKTGNERSASRNHTSMHHIMLYNRIRSRGPNDDGAFVGEPHIYKIDKRCNMNGKNAVI